MLILFISAFYIRMEKKRCFINIILDLGCFKQVPESRFSLSHPRYFSREHKKKQHGGETHKENRTDIKHPSLVCCGNSNY